MAHAGIAAFRLPRGPAGDFQALEAHFRRGVDGFFKVPAIQDGGQQSEMNHAFLSLCFQQAFQHLLMLSNLIHFRYQKLFGTILKTALSFIF